MLRSNRRGEKLELNQTEEERGLQSNITDTNQKGRKNMIAKSLIKVNTLIFTRNR